MQQRIVSYHKDEVDDWVAELSCRHFQHVRHNPPWMNREWVTTQSGRQAHIGESLNCKKCDAGKPVDRVTNN